ncbi:MAG: ABC transporter ATP-binding protein [Planctomycetes bacterium]|nr:ABC transporter ATP-binding protein [Planctomycetota bacterium]
MVTELVASALAYRYPDGIDAVRGVDLCVRAGVMRALVGPNGSGKSTLLRCMAGILKPNAGRATVDGTDVHALTPRERARRIAVVPQFLPSLFDVRVEDFVLGGRYASIDRWRGPSADDARAVREALSACDAAELAARAMSELSGGQRQRVVIARAIAQEAATLLVDEPTTSLDPEHQVQVFELLAQLASQGKAVLVVTHELNLASQFVDAMSVLAEGRVVASGAVNEILEPSVLSAVYGTHLSYGRDTKGRPFVLPARESQRPDALG